MASINTRRSIWSSVPRGRAFLRVLRRLPVPPVSRWFAIYIAAAVLVVAASYWVGPRPFPCQSERHHAELCRQWEAWCRGELTQAEILKVLSAYAELDAPFWEKRTFHESRSYGGYFSVHHQAIRRLGQLKTVEASELLRKYLLCPICHKRRYAFSALVKRGEPRAVGVLIKYLELEDQWCKENWRIYWRPPNQPTRDALTHIKRIAGPDAVPLLKDFLKKQRMFKEIVLETIFELEHDISKPVNVQSHVVRIELKTTDFRPGEELPLRYSATVPAGNPRELCAFGTTVAVDGNVVGKREPRVCRGGFSTSSRIPLTGLPPGEHTLSVKITDTDISDSVTFRIVDRPED